MLNRKVQEQDFEGIHKLMSQVHNLHVINRPDIYKDIDVFNIDYLKYILNDHGIISMVTELDKEIIGFCVVRLKQPQNNPKIMERKVAWVDELCVDEGHRNLGIGKALFNEVKRIVKESGYDNMELMVWSFNDDAIKFYESIGMNVRSIVMEQKI